MKHPCIDCGTKMKKSFLRYKGIPMEVMQCPKCKIQVYTQEQAHKAMLKLEAQRLKKEYLKKAIKIGHSWGITFPKEIADLFEFNKPSAKLKICPDLARGKLMISLG